MARRKTRIASSSFAGGPQIPRPVSRIAPKPRRRTFKSPPIVSVPSGKSISKTPVQNGRDFEAIVRRSDERANISGASELSGSVRGRLSAPSERRIPDHDGDAKMGHPADVRFGREDFRRTYW